MPGQKRKYNVRFPPGRIKKIMQKDTEVGRMATAVPVIISKALEMFLISFLTKTSLITHSKNSRVMSVNHMKQCIESEKLFDFLKDLAVQACGASTQKEVKAKGKCPGQRYRTKCSVGHCLYRAFRRQESIFGEITLACSPPPVLHTAFDATPIAKNQAVQLGLMACDHPSSS
uniref:Dr1-associated corepressor-like n=1 Tax=Astyanax mexicanus TaxID=7994 RepID=A0A8B9HB15_ASTMX